MVLPFGVAKDWVVVDGRRCDGARQQCGNLAEAPVRARFFGVGLSGGDSVKGDSRRQKRSTPIGLQGSEPKVKWMFTSSLHPLALRYAGFPVPKATRCAILALIQGPQTHRGRMLGAGCGVQLGPLPEFTTGQPSFHSSRSSKAGRRLAPLGRRGLSGGMAW